jgi:hypothetical protein
MLRQGCWYYLSYQKCHYDGMRRPHTRSNESCFICWSCRWHNRSRCFYTSHDSTFAMLRWYFWLGWLDYGFNNGVVDLHSCPYLCVILANNPQALVIPLSALSAVCKISVSWLAALIHLLTLFKWQTLGSGGICGHSLSKISPTFFM